MPHQANCLSRRRSDPPARAELASRLPGRAVCCSTRSSSPDSKSMATPKTSSVRVSSTINSIMWGRCSPAATVSPPMARSNTNSAISSASHRRRRAAPFAGNSNTRLRSSALTHSDSSASVACALAGQQAPRKKSGVSKRLRPLAGFRAELAKVPIGPLGTVGMPAEGEPLALLAGAANPPAQDQYERGIPSTC